MKKVDSIDGHSLVEYPRPKHASPTWKRVPNETVDSLCKAFIRDDLGGTILRQEYLVSDNGKCIGTIFFSFPHVPTLVDYTYEWFLLFVNLNDHRTPLLLYPGIKVDDTFVVLEKIEGGNRQFWTPELFAESLHEQKCVFSLEGTVIRHTRILTSEEYSAKICAAMAKKLISSPNALALLDGSVPKACSRTQALVNLSSKQSKKEYAAYLERLFRLQMLLKY